MTLNELGTTHIVPVYFLAGYEYYGRSRTMDLIPHPDLGATFFDDSVPPQADEITDLGRFGFNMDGYAPCAQDPVPVPVQDESWGSVKVLFQDQ